MFFRDGLCSSHHAMGDVDGNVGFGVLRERHGFVAAAFSSISVVRSENLKWA